MISWPISLVAELAERRCVVFLGSGASAASPCDNPSKKLPNWEGLLGRLRELLSDTETKQVAQDLITKKQYLDAAQVIHDGVNAADFRRVMREIFAAPRFHASRLHELCHELDQKIVITTNYDEIYENYCRQGEAAEAYVVYKHYDSNPLNGIRSPDRVILKAHGCVSEPSKMVLTRKQYFEARRTYPGFYDLLDALFLTNTVLFLGYSISDPDIALVLENANISAPSSFPHYAVVEDDRHTSLVRVVKDTYNVELMRYPAGDHSSAVKSLEDLVRQVLDYRERHGA